MKTLELEPTAFVLFKQRAHEFRISFMCALQKGIYKIEAQKEDLEKLGYVD